MRNEQENAQQLVREADEAQAFARSQLDQFSAAADADGGRDLTDAEKDAVEAATDRARELVARATKATNRVTRHQEEQALRTHINSIAPGNAASPYGRAPNGSPSERTLELGPQFTDSPTYGWLKDTKNSRAGTWSSPASELRAATLTEDLASGGDLVVADVRPGILALPTRPLVVSGLMAQGVTDSNMVTYMKETTFTNAAAAVAEGAPKPESTLIFDAINEPVKKLAHWVPVTEEMLEDVPALRAYLNARLQLGVSLTEDDQLLNGSGIAANMTGLLNRTGLAPSIARGTDTNADVILRQMAAIFVATGLQPTGIVMNPSNWLAIQLLKNDGGEYVAGNGPFSAPQAPTLWGLPVALTSAMAAGTALVGAFRSAAQVFRKGGLRVEATNSHADYFVKNLIAIRAEERLALAVYRPAAIGTVTGLL